MTCQDCSLYMRSEENGLHQSIDGVVYYGIPFTVSKNVCMVRNNNENNVGVGAGLLQ